MNKKILVATTDYPDPKGKVILMYIHVRNIYYKEHGLDITVLNFSAKENYTIDGIKVITLNTYKQTREKYKLLICHAANLRNHYIFLKKFKDNFPKIIFFYHGHEVLKINKTYSEPYDFARPLYIKKIFRDIYDDIKLYIWNRFIITNISKIFLVFVSEWMLNEFLKATKVPFNIIKENYMITYNCIGKQFEEMIFNSHQEKEYDFLTIRANLDVSKYSVDIVNELANKNPNMKFLLYGKGTFFKHFKKAPNLIWVNRTLNHYEISNIIQKCRCALMPTRTDSQGLMMCELASTGIPLITSDIPVCHEVFNDFDNIAYINNDDKEINLEKMLIRIEKKEPYERNKKYFNKNTSLKEVNLIESIILDKGKGNG